MKIYAGRAILVGLDELFDTRLGTIVQHRPDVFEALEDDEYYERMRDDFPGLPYDEFRALYDQRNEGTLLQSLTTPVLDMAMQLIFQLHAEMMNEPFRKLPTLVINTHPYSLSQEAKEGLLLEIHATVGKEVPLLIDFVTLSPKELTISLCAQIYDAVFLYDYFEWVDLHASETEFIKPTYVKLIGPALFKDRDVVKSVLIDEQTGLHVHPMTVVQLLLNRYFDADIIPVRIFSAWSPTNNMDVISKIIREVPKEEPIHASAIDPEAGGELSPFTPLDQTDYLPSNMVLYKKET